MNRNVPHCTQCGTEVGTDASFCSSCGENLEKSSGNTSSEPISESEPELGEATDDDVIPTANKKSTEPDSERDIDYRDVGIALLLGLIPAFVGYLVISVAAGAAPLTNVFWIGIPVFGYLIYRKSNRKAMLGGMFFWLSVESFLSPVFLLIYVFTFASETGAAGTTAGAAGTAIGGILLAGGAFVVGVPLGIALYLVSRRLDSS